MARCFVTDCGGPQFLAVNLLGTLLGTLLRSFALQFGLSSTKCVIRFFANCGGPQFYGVHA